jgi:hypothetical protein
VAKLPAYGFLPFGSFDFTPTRLQISLHLLSLKDGFADGLIDLEYRLTGPTWGEQIFGFQIPHKIEIDERGYKMWGLYPDGSYTVIQISHEVIETRNDTSIIYFNFTAPPEIWDHRFMVEFRWKDIIDKIDFFSYEVECPFQISQDNNVVEEQLPGVSMMHHEGLTITYSIAMPPGSSIQSAIPPPDKEEIYWLSLQNETRQYRFITFSQNVHFGRLSQLPELNCFRVTLELTEEKDRYEKLLFNSGLFLGLGVSLILSGVYETIKYEKDRKKE